MTVLKMLSVHSPGGPGAPPTSKSPAFLFTALPDDLIQLLFYPLPGGGGRHRYLPPTAFINFACTCKAAAAIALPALYSNLHLPSMAALPQVFATVASPQSSLLASLELRDHVRSITVSPYFVSKDQFHLLSQPFHTGCKLDKDSWIVSTLLVSQRLTPESRAKLPMKWFTRIAALCPQLVSVDLSNLPNLGRACPAFLYGFQGLAGILRSRGGRFTSASHMPVSAVLVNDDKNRDGHFVHNVYFVTRLDWGRKEIDVANYVDQRDMATVPDKPDMDPGHFALVPFVDIIGDAEEQAQWSIRDMSIRVADREWLALLAEDSRKDDRDTWINSDPRLYKRAGIRKGKDRVFDMNPATAASLPTIKGKVIIATPYIQELQEMTRVRGIETRTQCTQVDLHGSNAMVSWMSLMNKPEEYKMKVAEKITQLRPLSLNPLRALRRFVVHDAFFFTADTTESVLESMSTAMPNVLDLSLLNLQVPMDFVLMSIDTHFIRRMPQDGKRLQHLRVTCFCPMYEDPVWCNAGANQLGITAASKKMFDGRLDATMDLRTLTLEASGSTHALPLEKQPKVAIHPDVLHQLESLTVYLVTLVPFHPELLCTTRSAFLTARAILNIPASLDQKLQHVAMPNLLYLQLSTSGLMREPRLNLPTGLPVPSRDARIHRPTTVASHGLPESLPSCPRLAELVLTTNTPQATLSAALVTSVLARYPTLVRAELVYTQLSKGELHQLARTLWDPASGTHPRLRNLVLENMGGSGCTRYMSMPHVLHTDLAAVAACDMADPRPTTVELDAQPMQLWCDREGALAECAKCRMKVRVQSPRAGARRLFMSSVHDGSGHGQDRNAGHAQSSLAVETHCPNCAPSALDRVWVKQRVADAREVEQPSATTVEVDAEEDGDDGKWEDWCSDDDEIEEDQDRWESVGANTARAGVEGMWGIKMRFPGEF